ncbi:MAG: CHASE2 domain-containing protein [Bacillota bacterium]
MIIIIVSLIYFSGLVTDIEATIYDYSLVIKSLIDDSFQDEIVIIKIDEASLKNIQNWPWPRDYHASLIELLDQEQAKIIGFDVILDLETKKEDDRLLANRVENAGNVILPGVLDIKASRNLQGTSYKIVDKQYPLEILKDSASGMGYINLVPDRDGKIRRINLINNDMNSFAASVVQEISGNKQNKVQYINYHDQNYFQEISYHKVLDGEFPEGFFKDKIVLVGATATGLGDNVMTPLSIIRGYTPGIRVHAEIIDNYLHNSFITKVNDIIIFLIIILTTFSSLWLFNRKKPQIGINLLAGLILFIIILSLWLLLRYNMFIPVIPMILPAVFGFIAGILTWYLKSESRRVRLYNIFTRYLPSGVIEQILKLPEEKYFERERQEITVVFVDLDGFTSFLESKEQEAVVKMLNRYLSIINEETTRLQGIVDKFLGDGVMIIFGAPQPQDDHAIRAVRLALSLQQKISKDKDLPLSLSIAINSGKAIIGNIGSKERSDYTAIGDVVNTAARIEEIIPAGDIMVSEATYKLVTDNYEMQLWRKVKLRDKKKEVKLYRPE